MPAAAWMLGLGAQADEDEGESLLGTLYVGVGSRTWLTFVAGQSSSPADRADIEADTLVLGVDHRFDKVGFTLESRAMGRPGALETEDLAGSVYFDRDRWRIGFGYEARDIEIPFTLTGPLGGHVHRDAHVSADSVGLNARVALGERWQLYFGLAEHDYDRDLDVLPRIASLNLLSTSTLTLANSFLDHERYVAVERELGRASAERARHRPIVPRSTARSSRRSKRRVLFPIGNRVDLEVNLGNGRSAVFRCRLVRRSIVPRLRALTPRALALMAARRSSCSALPSASPSSRRSAFTFACIDAAGRAQRRAQPIGLRVGAFLEALAAARVGLAGEQHLVEPLRLPQAVGGHDQVAAPSAP